MYTLREFRANTKQAFDDSAEGHEVVITRGKHKFQLVSLVDKALPGHSFESQPNKTPKVIVPTVRRVNLQPIPKFHTARRKK